MQRFAYESLLELAGALFLKLGATEKDARLAATVLLSADLRGIDSHGLARLPGYVRLWEKGRIDLKAKPSIIHETASTATIDAQSGLGLIVAPFAMETAIRKASVCGTGWVSVCNSSHFGIAGYHSMLALPHNMIGIALTNASPTVAPTFARERLLGTNPISIAIPAGKEPAFVADFATTTASNGKLEILQRIGEDTPEGWVQNAEGEEVTDAHALKNGGALLPLGSTREGGSHKGYMLGSIVDIFSAVLSGANYGPWVPPFPAYLPMPENMPGKGIGHFFGAMRIDAFRPADDFQEHMDNWIRRFREAKSSGQQKVLIPGDPEREIEKTYRQTGIPIDNQVFAELQKLTEQFGLHAPVPF